MHPSCCEGMASNSMGLRRYCSRYLPEHATEDCTWGIRRRISAVSSPRGSCPSQDAPGVKCKSASSPKYILAELFLLLYIKVKTPAN